MSHGQGILFDLCCVAHLYFGFVGRLSPTVPNVQVSDPEFHRYAPRRGKLPRFFIDAMKEGLSTERGNSRCHVKHKPTSKISF